ncbi:putative DNA ligase 4 [Klebsormidium nitens]|uniref:DNA ligase n=1 Tax=Klebsormidium nitens TaxID=105231 RepID=A0A1Y1HR72_KLENI|nr:putative DNA ligase 4 [Klebsormidium nitens]|eukprot:GAQ79067.1 putative DNA ligase 4 [Klebsormidium nitens]
MEFFQLCRALELTSSKKEKKAKQRILRRLLDRVTRDGHHSVLRLLVPQRDKSRPPYNMQTTIIGQVIGDALGLAADSADVKTLVEWRSGGDAMGVNAGNFALSCVEVLAARQRATPSGITCERINEFLDRFSKTTYKDVRVAIFRELIHETTTLEMKWIIAILLKELRFGLGDEPILETFHPDAVAFYNTRCDLRALCATLTDRNTPWNRTGIELGTAFVPQHLKRGTTVQEAWKQMKGKSITVEHKFDGDRMLLHKNGDKITFISRNAILHPEYLPFGELLKEHLPARCILDGELVTWDKERRSFGPRTKASNKNAARALRKDFEHHEQNCFVAFDIVFLGDSDLLNRSLQERKIILEKLVPEVPSLLYRVLPGVAPFSILPKTEQEVDDFFSTIVTAGDEGIVLKDLASPYECGDKSGAWLKVKPDYVNGAVDLDVLIIGGFYGQGHHGGKVGQFLCGIADRPLEADRPTKFLSFCRVGTGFTKLNLRALRERLEPFKVRNVPGSKPPRCYEVTASKLYSPDVWYDPPSSSVVLTISCDNKPRPTWSFAAPCAPCFARCHEIRYDKPWYDCLIKTELIEIVAQNGVITGEQYAALAKKHKHPKRGVKRKASGQPLVPPHLQLADMSHVQPETDIFEGLVLVICNTPEGQSKADVSRLIARHGGHVSENVTDDVTHAVAGRPGGIKWSAICARMDIIHTDWLAECDAQGELLPVRPRHRLHLAELANDARSDELDGFGDSYDDDIEEVDLRQIFSKMTTPRAQETPFDVGSFECKHGGDLRTGLFRGCVAFLHEPMHSSNPDSREVAAAALRRLGLEIEFRGGAVVSTLSNDVTHVVVYVSPAQPLGFDRILKRKTDPQQRLLRRPAVSVVSQGWAEESLARGVMLNEADFSMRPESAIEWPQTASPSAASGPHPSSGTNRNLKPSQNSPQPAHESTVSESKLRATLQTRLETAAEALSRSLPCTEDRNPPEKPAGLLLNPSQTSPSASAQIPSLERVSDAKIRPPEPLSQSGSNAESQVDSQSANLLLLRRVERGASGGFKTGADCGSVQKAAMEPGQDSDRSNGTDDVLHGPKKLLNNINPGEHEWCGIPRMESLLGCSLDAESQAQTSGIASAETGAQASRREAAPLSSIDTQPATSLRGVDRGGRRGVSKERAFGYDSGPSANVSEKCALPTLCSAGWISGSDSEKENPGRQRRNGKRPAECVAEARRATLAAGTRTRPLSDLPLGAGAGNDVTLSSRAGKRARPGAELVDHKACAVLTSQPSSPLELGTVPGALPPSHRVTAPQVKEAVGGSFEVVGGSLDSGVKTAEQTKSVGVGFKPKKKVCYRDVLLGFSAPR